MCLWPLKDTSLILVTSVTLACKRIKIIHMCPSPGTVVTHPSSLRSPRKAIEPGLYCRPASAHECAGDPTLGSEGCVLWTVDARHAFPK